MKSHATKRFWDCYGDLPPGIQSAARSAFEKWTTAPSHPGLKFKRVHARGPFFSVRIARGWRALGVLDDDTMTWFWIESHGQYDQIISRL